MEIKTKLLFPHVHTILPCRNSSVLMKHYLIRDRSINKGTSNYRICDAKRKYNGNKYSKTSHGYINIEKTLIVFSHVEQPNKSKIILGRENGEISAYSREEPASLELNPLLW